MVNTVNDRAECTIVIKQSEGFSVYFVIQPFGRDETLCRVPSKLATLKSQLSQSLLYLPILSYEEFQEYFDQHTIASYHK
jgi:hypothetical protein